MTKVNMSSALPDGILVRGSDSSVYLIERGTKRPIADPESLYHYKLSLKHMIRIEDGFLNEMVNGETIRRCGDYVRHSPSTLLVRGGDSAVYVWMGGRLFPIATSGMFRRLCYQAHQLVNLPDSLIASLPIGELIDDSFFLSHSAIDGRLYSGPDGFIYYGEQRKLRKLEVPSLFSYFRWDVGQLIYLTGEEFANSPIGEPIADFRSTLSA